MTEDPIRLDAAGSRDAEEEADSPPAAAAKETASEKRPWRRPTIRALDAVRRTAGGIHVYDSENAHHRPASS